jgi:acetylornithine deacetylase/succinyl-diaminopimelate desuccinylase-like protein
MDLIERALGELPVNVKFLIEGEEEAGSEHLRDFAVARCDFLKADGCILEVATATPGLPSEIECGAKGFVDFELTAGGSPRFPQRDVHSGLDGGVPNAPWRLVWALNSLRDESENILIEGVDGLVEKPSEEDLAALREFGEDMTEMLKKDYGLSETLRGRSGLDLLQAVYMRPSITICGVTSGYQGPGSKAIVPSTASAKVEFRLVPNLTAQKAEEMIRAHLIKRGFDDIEVRSIGIGYDPSRTPINHPFIRMTQELSNEVAAPARARLVPISFGCGPDYLFAPHAPCCLASSEAELYGTNIHAPNENLPLSSLTNIMAFAATLAERLASL